MVPRVLDHLFLRGADVQGSTPARVDYRYGSDHHPVLAWIRLTAADDIPGNVTGH
jgi:endonuclease/exonuclease/phosphatase (EEP) superfamily protein YafD